MTEFAQDLRHYCLPNATRPDLWPALHQAGRTDLFKVLPGKAQGNRREMMETWKECGASSPANAVINIDVAMVTDIEAPFIALALANRRPIAGVWKLHGRRCQALLPKQPSHALCTTLKTLRYFRRKTSMLAHRFRLPTATSYPDGHHADPVCHANQNRPSRPIFRSARLN
jgi:hypothetical protein